MYTVVPRNGEEITYTLKRLKNKILMDGLMDELFRLRSYENPRDKKKRKLRLSHKKMKAKNR